MNKRFSVSFKFCLSDFKVPKFENISLKLGNSFCIANNQVAKIGKYEKGQNRIPIVNLIRISKFLNKPLDYFLDIDKETMIQSFMAKMDNEMRK